MDSWEDGQHCCETLPTSAWMHDMRALLLVLSILAACNGCARDCYYSAVNEWRAHRAWSHADCGKASRGEYRADFSCGWKRGYFDVSTGKPGDCPVLPP